MDKDKYPGVDIRSPTERRDSGPSEKFSGLTSAGTVRNKSVDLPSPQPIKSLDYFSLHRQSNSIKSSGHLLSPGNNSNMYPSNAMPQYAPKRYPSKFNLTLSPMVTSPSSGTEEKSSILSPVSVTPGSVTGTKETNHPSIVSKLEAKAFNTTQDRNILNHTSALLSDFLNVSLEDGQIHSSYAFDYQHILNLLEEEYVIIRKLYDDEINDPIFCFIAQHKNTQKYYILRFVDDIISGPFARMINTYYTTNGYNARTTKQGFPHLIEGSEWFYSPRTLPLNVEGVISCENLQFINDSKSLFALFPIEENYIPIKEFKLTVTKHGMVSTITLIINILNLLKRIHTYGIVVNSLTTSNIFINPTTLEVFVFDFDFSFSSATEFLDSPSRLANRSQSMSYIPFTAPENLSTFSPVDFRADIYSVGMIVYILMGGETRKPNIKPNSTVSLIHKRQFPLVDIDPNVPLPLSKIISKMTNTDPDLRYSCIDFAIYDLTKLSDTLTGNKTSNQINKEYQRIPIMIPYKIIGRDKIIKEITSKIITKSMKAYALVGFNGVGKSTIMKSMKDPAIMNGHFFVTWKCFKSDIHNSNFQTVDLVLSQFIKSILAMDKPAIRFWKNLLSKEVKADLSILFETVPELKTLLGSKYKSTRSGRSLKIVPQKELIHRYIIKKMFELFSLYAGVVFTIENIQHLSENESTILQEVWNHLSEEFQNGEVHFVLLASYASEVETTTTYHNLPKCFRKNIIRVNPLTLEDVSGILDSCLLLYDMQFKWKELDSGSHSYFYDINNEQKQTPERRKMAETIFTLSRGCPISVKEIIIQTHFAQLESQEALDPVKVFFNIDNINVYTISGYIGESTHNNGVIVFSEKTKDILNFCACISVGSTFNLHDLSVVSNTDPVELYKILFTATIVGIMTLSSNISKLPLNKLNEEGFILNDLSEEKKKNLLKCTKFRLAHDLIQSQLTKKMIENNELEEYHRLCGMRLFKNRIVDNNGTLKSTITSSDCYSVALHFVHSWSVARSDEIEIYIKVLITAAWCAYASYEYISALEYFKTAKLLVTDLEVMKGLDWIEIHIHLLKGNFKESMELSEHAIQKYSENTDDHVQFLISKMQILCSENRWEEGYDVALTTLKVLQFELDLSNISPDEIRQYSQFKLKPKLPSSISEIKNLRNLPNNANRRILLTQTVLIELSIFAIFLEKPHLLYFANLFNFKLLMEWGRSIYCSLSTILIASIEAAADAKGLKRAREYCRLAFSMTNSANLEANELFTSCFKGYCVLVGSVLEPIEKVIYSHDLIRSNVNSQGLETIFTRSFFLKFKFYSWLGLGLTLPQLKQKMSIIKENFTSQDEKESGLEDSFSVLVGALSILEGDLTYESYVDMCEQIVAANPAFKYRSELVFASNCVFGCYLTKKFERATEILLNRLVPAWTDRPVSIELVWSKYLFVLVVYKDRVRSLESNESRDITNNEIINKQLRDHLDYFTELSKQNTGIFSSMFLSVSALLQVLDLSNYSQIDNLSAFERALEECYSCQNYLLEAMISEECGRWLLKCTKDEKIQSKYLRRAYNCYETWGLTLKVNQLKNEFGAIISSQMGLNDGIKFQKKRSKSFIEEQIDNKVDGSNLDSPEKIAGSKTWSPSRKSSESTMIMSMLLKHDSSSVDDSSRSTRNEQDSNTSKSIDMSEGSVTNSKSQIDETDEIDDFNGEQDSFAKASISDEEWDKNIIMDLSIKLSQINNVEELLQTLLIFSMHFIECEYGCVVLKSEDGTPFIRAICLQNDEVKFMSQEVLAHREDLLPSNLIQECMKTDTTIWRGFDPFNFDSTYKLRDSYFINNDCQNVACIPIRDGNSFVAGALYLENERESTFIQSKKIELLEYISLQTLISISKIEMLEKLQIAKKTAEDATADKASFLANMSHEIRTPFNSLMSCAIFLLDTSLSRSQRMYVETIRSSALVTLNIIDGILSFSKLEHGSLTLEYEPFNLNLCIEDAIQLVAEQSSIKNLELVFIDDSYPVNIIYGDKTRVTQIIINLMGNATKFTNKGFVVVRTRVNEISDSRYEIKISVKDSGIGIPPGNKSKLFKMFNQLDGSSKRIHGGSGLGLAISKKIAELMGGDIDYESKESVGTEFFFTFFTNGKTEPIEQLTNEKVKVLIADGRKLSTDSLHTALLRRGVNSSDIKLITTLDDDMLDSMTKTGEFADIDVIFFSHEFIKSKLFLQNFRDAFPKSLLVCLIPFGVKIPEFLKDEEFDTADEENNSNNNNVEDNPLIDLLLLTPFKSQRILEILKLAAERHEEEQHEKKESVDIEVGSRGMPAKTKEISFSSIKSERKLKAPAKVAKLSEKFPLTILIVEDNAINTKVVRLQLKRLGYDSDHAEDGVEAIEMMDAKVERDGVPYNLVLMDLQMPRKDGFEATIEIKGKYGNQTRVVALSANVYTEEKNRCQEIGMSGFLNKPLLPDALAKQLEAAYAQYHGPTKASPM